MGYRLQYKLVYSRISEPSTWYHMKKSYFCTNNESFQFTKKREKNTHDILVVFYPSKNIEGCPKNGTPHPQLSSKSSGRIPAPWLTQYRAITTFLACVFGQMVFQKFMWVFPKIGVPGTPTWMVKIMENPIKMDDLGG